MNLSRSLFSLLISMLIYFRSYVVHLFFTDITCISILLLSLKKILVPRTGLHFKVSSAVVVVIALLR